MPTAIHIEKLDRELKAAGIPIYGVASSGEVDFKPEATAEQRALAGEIVAHHDPEAPTAEDLRRQQNPLWSLALENVASWVEQQDSATLNRHLVEAFVLLRDRVLLGSVEQLENNPGHTLNQEEGH